MKMFLFKFRPSSHSSDYTIVARFRTDRETEEAYRELERLIKEMDEEDAEIHGVDWCPGDAFYCLRDKTVYFSVYSSGRLGPVGDILSEAEDYNVYTNYQELTISVEVLKGLNFKSAMLVLDKEEAEAIKWFREKCGEPKVIDCGDEIYYDDTLYVGFEFYAGNRDNWEVA